jgi:hypothetical protein
MPTYEMTVDGATETVDETALLDWFCENGFDPGMPSVDATLALKPGQSHGENLDGFNAASWLVRRVS